jgi:hypothetical protein
VGSEFAVKPDGQAIQLALTHYVLLPSPTTAFSLLKVWKNQNSSRKGSKESKVKVVSFLCDLCAFA